MQGSSMKKIEKSVAKKAPFIRPKSLAYKQNPVDVYCRLKPVDQGQQPIQLTREENTIIITDNDKFTKTFSFDKIFDEKINQEQLVKEICAPIIKRMNQQGKGSLVFTYGVTNSGKTHTILGTMQQPGILPYLIKNLQSQEEEIKIQAIELYNDEFFSLKDKQKIVSKQMSGYISFQKDISEEINEQNMDYILSRYMNNRSQNYTKINPKSSRSHAIFRIIVDGTIICVVDLAGSERVHKTGVLTIQQSSSINKSLLSLGRCIQALKEQAYNSSIQIPYRQSRLTKLLMEFFSPNYKNYLVVNLNQSKNLLHENLKVLEYAALAKEIKKIKNLPSNAKSLRKQTFQQAKSQQLPSIQKSETLVTKALCNSMVRIHHWRQCQFEKQKAQQQYYQQIKRLKKQIELKCKKQKIQRILDRLQGSQQSFQFFFEQTFQKQRQESERILQQIRQSPLPNTTQIQNIKTFTHSATNTDKFYEEQQMRNFKEKIIKQYKQQLERLAQEQKKQIQFRQNRASMCKQQIIETPMKSNKELENKQIYSALSGPLNFMKSSAKKIYDGTTSIIEMLAKSRKKLQKQPKILSLISFEIFHAKLKSEVQTQQVGTQYQVLVIEQQQNENQNINKPIVIKQDIVKKRPRKQKTYVQVKVTPIKARLRRR